MPKVKYSQELRGEIQRMFETGCSIKNIQTELLEKFNTFLSNRYIRIIIERAGRQRKESQAKKITVELKGDTGTIESGKTDRIKTLDDLIREAQINLNEWHIDRHIINKWDNVSKVDGSKSPVVTELFQVKAFLKAKAPNFLDVKQDIIKELLEYSPEVRSNFKRTQPAGGNMLLVNIFDAHIEKMCREMETGSKSDIDKMESVFMDAVINIVGDATSFREIQRIIFPIGNDFFNADNHHHTTTGGTPQDQSVLWREAYKRGRKLLVKAIDLMAQHAPVGIVVVPGNHDYNSMFTIGDALELYYENNQNVSVINSTSPRGYVRWGKTLLGFTHGSEEKQAMLPLLMMREMADEVQHCQFFDWYLGHIHTRKAFAVSIGDESMGVQINYMSSLSGTDSWHNKKGYVMNRRGAEGILYGQNGKVATFIYNY